MSGIAVPGALLGLLAVALALWPDASGAAAVRLRELGWRRSRSRAPTTLLRIEAPARRWLLAAGAALPVGLLSPGLPGLAVAGAVLVGVERLLRRAAVRARSPDGRLLAELPLACDLLAVCLAAGVPLPGALAAVAGAVPEPLGAELQRVAGLAALGADAGRAWNGAPAVLEPVARTLRRSETSGARAGAALQALAVDLRASARAATDAAVQRAAVHVLAPLGLCFLPAFVCLGIAPMVIGLAGDVLG